jgi:hypothetical protein
VALSTRMWWSLQKSRNFLLVNWVPLSVMMEFGTSKRWMMLVNPLGEFVDGDQQVREAPGCLL